MITLSPGSKAPAFTALNQEGKKVSLKDYLGKKVVLYFYPQDDTPTCTIQACNLRDNFALLKKKGFEVLGVSPDKPEKHKKFETRYKLPFTLIADPDKIVIEKYGVWGPKKMFGTDYMGVLRTTFVIDEKGNIRHVFIKPKTKMHAEEIIAAWGS